MGVMLDEMLGVLKQLAKTRRCAAFLAFHCMLFGFR